MRRTKEEAQETREAILVAAERLFTERGAAEVSLDEVAEAAGFTRGALHWHFQNKQGLLLSLLDRKGLPLRELVEEVAVDAALDPLHELIGVLTRILSEIQKDTKQQRLVTYLTTLAAIEAPERQREFERDLRTSIVTIFRWAGRRGRLAPEWPAEVAGLAFYGMLSGLVNTWLRGEADFDLSRDTMKALRSFIATASRPGPSRGR